MVGIMFGLEISYELHQADIFFWKCLWTSPLIGKLAPKTDIKKLMATVHMTPYDTDVIQFKR